jgi:hypothetical protein
MAFSLSDFIERQRKQLFSQCASDNDSDPRIKSAILGGRWTRRALLPSGKEENPLISHSQ